MNSLGCGATLTLGRSDIGRKECTWILTKYMKYLGSTELAVNGDKHEIVWRYLNGKSRQTVEHCPIRRH